MLLTGGAARRTIEERNRRGSDLGSCLQTRIALYLAERCGAREIL